MAMASRISTSPARSRFIASHGKLATVTAVRPPGRYGALEIDGPMVKSFVEKPPGDNAYINGGFFVLNPAVIDRIEGDKTSWEASAAGGAGAGCTACGLPSLRLLAADGYPARQDAS